MIRHSSRAGHRWLALVVTGMTALAVLTACAGSAPERSRPATAALNEGAGAPAPEFEPPPLEDVQRDVVKTASMTLTVADPSLAADEAAVVVETADGRVDSRSEDAGSGVGRARTSIVLRVPAAKLDGVVRELKTLGSVQSAETTSEDVTAQRVDLDARIKALQTSVDRLLAIMRDAGDPDALITAEDALSERQAELDSLRAQRDQLGDRIEYSTVDVTFVAEQLGGPEPQQYEGFTGQIERGWDALVFVARNVVLLFGLLLPWLGALAVVGGLIYGAVRVSRVRRRKAEAPPNGEDPAADQNPSGVPDESSDGPAIAPLER